MTDYTLEQAVQDFKSIGDRMQKNNETLASNNQKLQEMATTLASCHLVSKEDLLDTLAAARYLGVTQPDTIRNWFEGGSFPGAFQSRGQWFFPAVELVKIKRRMDEILAFNFDGKIPQPVDFGEACKRIAYDRGQPDTAAALQRIRRPKPPSLKEQALSELAAAVAAGDITPERGATIRLALEALPQ